MCQRQTIYTSLSNHTVFFFVFLLLSFCLVLVLPVCHFGFGFFCLFSFVLFFSVASEEFPAAFIMNAHKDSETEKARKQSC